MKSTIHQYAKRALALLSSGACALTLLQTPILATDRVLENSAKDFEITVPSEQNGKPKENLVDGDDTTLWVNNGAEWPSEIRFKTPADTEPLVYKLVVKFEKGHSAWKTDVKISHVVNDVTDQPVVDKLFEGHSYDDQIVFEWEDGVQATEFLIELSNPKNGDAAGGYWPALAEVELYTEKVDEPDDPSSDLINITPSGTISSITSGQGVPSNLCDGDYKTLYVFSKGLSTTDGQAWVQVDFDRLMDVKEIEAAFENLGEADASEFVFHYDILGRKSDDEEWSALAANQSATRLNDGCIQKVAFEEIQQVKSIRVLITSIDNTGGDPWPALAELKILAPKDSALDIPKGTNIAEGKKIHTNTNQDAVESVVDGSLSTVWNGEMYPSYIDIDLGENYNLSDAVVYTPTSGYSQYSIYTSMDGVDFDRVARKTTKDSATDAGETWQLEGKEARIVRLYTEYNSANARSQIREFVLHGTPSNTPVQQTPAVSVSDFEDTDYAAPVTQQDTIEEVQGIISRRIGEQCVDWFAFELKDQENGYDYYDVEAKDGKIHITGNNGVSLATGLNAYLEKVVNVHISQVGDQVTMPASIVLPTEKMHKETKFPVRYSYNFCTLSYSMAYWGEQEWRNELDWLALNGVNVVLDATGMEEVWRRFLSECGYTHEEIKDFIAGPAYYAWFYMANLSGMGGPLPDSWFEERTDLARKNHRIMQVLGMQPVLQGYCGMVPVDFAEKQPDAKVIAQGKWCSFQRPYMLKTDDASTYDKYADLFYKVQKDVFGDITDYYATDPFHEGGNTGGMNATVIAQRTLAKMMDNDPDAVWIIQSWQRNPSQALLSGLEGNREHALILDLYAERQPHWNSASFGGEFQNTPWVFCMLNNFGGRLGLYGHLDGLEKVAEAANTAGYMAGIGITPEASENNPLLYEYIFDTIWTEDADAPLEVMDLDEWTEAYARRRYGAESESAVEALKIMEETVYAGNANEAVYGPNATGQGAPENVINSRPALSVNSASTWGWSSIHYSRARLEQALELLIEDYDKLKDTAGYHYDLIALIQQCISNYAQGVLAQMNTAASSNDLESFTQWSDLFLELIDTSNRLLSTEKHFTLGNWTEGFGRLVSNPDDFTKDLFDLNAKALVTTWGSITQCNSGGLKDYSNRQWSDLTNDVYKKRWEMFIAEKKKQLAGESYRTFSANDWFEFEWAWARGTDRYTTETTDYDIQEIGQKVLEDYSIRKLEPEITLDGILDPATMHATAGSSSSSDPADHVLDDDNSTIWHTDWNSSEGIKRENCWIQLDFDEPATITSLLYMPRSGAGNGTITSYRIDVANDEGEGETQWTTVATGSWKATSGWKEALFDQSVVANKVRLVALNSINIENNSKVFGSAAEIRIKGTPLSAEELDYRLLETAVRKSEALDLADFNADGSAVDTFRQALAQAKALMNNASSQDEITSSARALHAALLALRLSPDADKLSALSE